MNNKIKKTLSAVLGAIIVLVGGYFGYDFVSESHQAAPQTSQSQSAVSKAEIAHSEASKAEKPVKPEVNSKPDKKPQSSVQEDKTYTSRDEVAEYIYEFHHLPSNFITKKEAQKLGWDSKAGNLHKAAPGKSIGGDRFGNYEGVLPKKSGRTYKECDIDYKSGHRGAKRIVFSNDGLIYYTDDHYKTFTLLYGEN